MTLGDVLPSLRSSLPPRWPDRAMWPLTTEHGRSGISLGGVPLMEVEEEFGTPAYVLDEADVRERCAAYGAAFGPAQVYYAAKALLSRGLLRWINEAGLGLAVYSTGQWQLAMAAGFPPERVVVHGDVDARGAGRVVIESAADVARLTCTRRPQRQKVMLRLLPAHQLTARNAPRPPGKASLAVRHADHHPAACAAGWAGRGFAGVRGVVAERLSAGSRRLPRARVVLSRTSFAGRWPRPRRPTRRR
ncbi:hypothetical protein [Catellatospora sp. NPDC049609]|uniref:hypothetical protein n=1 Tax=Catellatospora sp. NPDC049609 TaxID=3155505 RepID=UPI00342C64B9